MFEEVRIWGAVALAAVLIWWALAKQKRKFKPRQYRTFLHAVDQSPGESGPGATQDLDPDLAESLVFDYAPQIDGDPDPGEVIWTWVPYVENDGRGKDRPVLIIARLDEDRVAGCYLSTNPRDGYFRIGAGPWDSKGRVSYMNAQRLLSISADGMRREGSIVPRDVFERAAGAIRARHRF